MIVRKFKCFRILIFLPMIPYYLEINLIKINVKIKLILVLVFIVKAKVILSQSGVLAK